MTIKRATIDATSSASPWRGAQRRILGPVDHKAYEQFQQFKLWPKREVDYAMIDENITFRFIMREVG